jgi:hypothetical protein
MSGLSTLMLALAMIAVDCAALRLTLPLIPNPGLTVILLVLQIGVFATIRSTGSDRAWWLGFEAVGWAYLLICFPVQALSWGLPRFFFERIIGRTIASPTDTLLVIGFAGLVHLVVGLGLCLAGARFAQSRWAPAAVSGSSPR